uniref:Uncharacterized protein n=1 Tax=Arundo donax TaxID=35708 RepID=A0A0A8YQI5_ARUDO
MLACLSLLFSIDALSMMHPKILSKESCNCDKISNCSRYQLR